MSLHQKPPPVSVYPLPLDAVADVLRKWMRGESLNANEQRVVDLAMAENWITLHERMLASVIAGFVRVG